MPLIRVSRLLPALLVAAASASVPAAPATGPAVTPAALPAEAFLLPQDSVLVVGVNVHGFFASSLWSQVSSGQIGAAAGLTAEKSAEMAKEVQEGLAKSMAEMETVVGFRADRDLDWVVFGMRTPKAPTPEGVAVLVGRFDATRILSSVQASQTKDGNTVARKQVGGVTVLASQKAGQPALALAVASPRHLVMGSGTLVEALLAAHTAGRRPLEVNTAMTTRLRGVKPGTGIFMLADEALLKEGQGSTPSPLPLPKSLSLAFEFDGGTELAAEMASAAAAQEAATTIQGQLGMIAGMMSADPDPQKAVAGKMLTGLSVRVEGATLRVSGAPGQLGLGSVAAIAIPSLLRARVSANESAAIGDLRTVISAQAAYQSTNKGFYGELPCLSAPNTCIKGYTGPQFLDPQLTSLAVKSGYRRAFHPGKRGTGARSLRGYAYTAVPAEQGKTGLRSFCGEDSGVIRVDPKGGDIKPVGGVCPPTLEALK